MSDQNYKPDWTPEDAGAEFACRVMQGVDGGHDGMARFATTKVRQAATVVKRNKLTVDEYVEGILKSDRMVLSRAITLIESNSLMHMNLAQDVLQSVLPHTGKSIRIGITGVPGAGKSTFIEALGCTLCQHGHKVAVLAVDPSSSITKGSILGDKTRMEKLSREKNAFIRPSPSSGTLGGVTRKSRETLLLCEAAGYDVILVETVGVGQSEITVRSMVDFFLLVVLTGAGDELQGMKKGVMEIADAILINKADGDNKQKAEMVKVDYERILRYLRPATDGWQTKAHTCSALTGLGIAEIWQVMQRFKDVVGKSGIFESRRKAQTLDWVYSMVEEHLHTMFYQNEKVKKNRNAIETAVSEGKMSATIAMQKLIAAFDNAQK
ncbi:methylmalonyl Co-A mutase-associated GTPase MeaB [Anaerosinus massiliensis]|uniref:methylmalonyl Co-A mutase-associated GTPase MeaB n=1 Tax=Massilibacillus massiliensis TaxID=1806837 RepID=UPI000A5FB928|nr:methylmalonyl Co-A mutase-associated GTPase MeaB [Massilibacillus massiliensis]